VGITRPGCSRRALAAAVLAFALTTACGASASRRGDDLTTTTQVKIALLADPRLGPLRLEVATSSGVVTLTGTVPSDADARRAIDLARKVHGVHAVTSGLKIQPQ
jgi:hyperosmotically inducible periplasmic protein